MEERYLSNLAEGFKNARQLAAKRPGIQLKERAIGEITVQARLPPATFTDDLMECCACAPCCDEEQVVGSLAFGADSDSSTDSSNSYTGVRSRF